MRSVISRIWQVIVMSGQQRQIAMLTVLVSTEEAGATAAATTRAVAATIVRLLRVATALSVHFYICNAERCRTRGEIWESRKIEKGSK